MGSSKKKSSFRIDDLLQHQAHQDNPTPSSAHCQREIFTSIMQTSSKTAEPLQVQSSKNHRHASTHLEVSMPSVPHLHRIVKHIFSNNVTTSSSQETTTQTSTALQPMTTAKLVGHAAAMHTNFTEMSPQKPMPMYAPPSTVAPSSISANGNLLDMSKANYCFAPLPMAMTPPFSHAATAYLEHYANTFHKGN